MEIPPENTLSIDELQVAFSRSYGLVIGQLTFEKLNLEKRSQSLQTHISELERLITELEKENDRMVEAKISYEDHIAYLEAQVAQLVEFGPTIEQVAAQGKAIIEKAKIKETAPD